MQLHRRIAASLVAAALIAPAAAQASPDEGVLYSGSSAAQAPASLSPDDRPFSRAPALEAEALQETEALYGSYNTQTGVSPEPVQVVVHDDGGLAAEEAAAVANAALNTDRLVVVHDDGGFAWANAAEGAAVGFGFAAILAALAVLIVRSRRVVPAA
jgi:hypothetical protein